jgi:glycosyltransferase involved in cell wall biosynthesis
LQPHFTLPGGANKFILETAKRLITQGYQVVVLTGSVNKNYYEQYPTIKFHRINCPQSNSFSFWLLFPLWQYKINKTINQYQDKILFPQVFPANWWGFVYKILYPQTPCYWYCHEPSSFIHNQYWINAIHNPLKQTIAKIINPIFKLFDKFLVRHADKIIVNSNFTKKNAEQIYHKSVQAVIYPAFDIVNNHQNITHQKENFIFTVARLTKFKRIDNLIKAFAKLTDQNLQLVIAGNGEEKSNLAKLVEKLKLKNRIIFLGTISDEKLKQKMQTAKIFISTSRDEPFGITIIEAMACGTAVIADSSGGPKETIINHQTGEICGTSNIDLLAQTIQKILNNNNYLDYGKQAALHAHQKFTWETTVDKLRKIL